MVDITDHPEQNQEHEGASNGELLIEACRKNNTDLLQEVIDSCHTEEETAELLNNTKTVLGNHIYHEAALNGNYEIIDLLLDQPLFECDPLTRLDNETPLHSAIRYLNTLYTVPPSPKQDEILNFSRDLLNMMIEAGSDWRIKNKMGQQAIDLCDQRTRVLKNLLQEVVEKEEFRREQENEGEGGDEEDVNGVEEEDSDDDGVGSASDSDFDVEEYKREKERRRLEKLGKGGARS